MFIRPRKENGTNRSSPLSGRRLVSLVLVGWMCMLVMCCLSGCGSDDRTDSFSFPFESGASHLRSGIRTYLLMGIDTEGSLQEKKEPGQGGQSDAIYLLVCDMKAKKAKIIGIPRDTMTEIRVYLPSGKFNGTSVDHLTLQYAFGDGGKNSCDLMAESVSSLMYGLPIDGYLAVNLGRIPDLAEALGGVPVTVPDNSAMMEDPDFAEGETVILDKKNVKRFLRFRDIEVSQSAVTRMERHKAFFKGAAQKVRQLAENDPGTLPSLYRQYVSAFVTNLTIHDCMKIAELELDEKIEILPGTFTEGTGYDEFYVDTDALIKMIRRIFC